MGEAKRTHQKHGRHVDGSVSLDPSYTEKGHVDVIYE